MDFYGTDVVTGSAQGRREGMLGSFANGRQQWSQHSPNRSLVSRTIGMPADRLIDRTNIQAGSTANAGQNLTHRAIRQYLTAPVIDKHQIKFLWAVQLVAAARPIQAIHVAGHFLSGGTAGEKF